MLKGVLKQDTHRYTRTQREGDRQTDTKRGMAQRVTHSHSLFPSGQAERTRDVLVKSASAYADLQWEQQPRQDGSHPPQDYPHRDHPPVAGYVPQPDYMEGDDDLIKPKKLLNPVKASKSHQELHRELLMSQKRSGGVGMESKPELQRVLEARKREQILKQRKEEDEARKKISPLEQELLKRKEKLEELEKEQGKKEETVRAPEFVKVKENLRRTSFHNNGEKEV
ncbi:protein FAM107B-like isoform X1 [Oncorhynchus keta]|uniref:protein FAM107B-like isoform X1 n=1 Tax=Oncorhynchus keta TaxID=8018 RepID=UPI0015FD2570|nr:protein FAM107B-like isoform X1 [Oncorhynchus keta]